MASFAATRCRLFMPRAPTTSFLGHSCLRKTRWTCAAGWRACNMTARYDVLGLGCVAIDDLLYVDSYPAADTKVQIRRHERQCGGLTGTALVAAARQGSNCAYAGSLGEDELSQFVLDRLAQEGIDVTHVKRVADARPIHSVIIIDDKTRTRTVLYDLENVVGAQADWPPEDMIRAARVLFVDHFGVEGMIRAARIAKQAG